MRNCNQYYCFFFMEKICFKSDEKNAKKFLAPFPAFFFFFLKKIGLKIIFTHWNFWKWDMVKHELQVTSYEVNALKHDLKFKSASSNPRVTSANPRVTSSNPRIIKSMKTQVNSLKISLFPKILNCSAEWVNINFERNDLNFPQKSHPDFSFLSLTQNFMLCLLITTARHRKFLHIVSTVVYQTMVAHQCPLFLPGFLLDISLIKQPYSKVGNSRMYRYGNAIATLTFC